MWIWISDLRAKFLNDDQKYANYLFIYLFVPKLLYMSQEMFTPIIKST